MHFLFKNVMKTKKELVFTSDNQKKIFDFISSAIKQIEPEDYQNHQNEAKAVVMLPSIRAEYGKTETFNTPFDNSVNGFKTKAEFWLRTVFFKLEEDKINRLITVGRAMKKHNQESEDKHRPIELVLVAMSIEPQPEIYVKNKEKEKLESKLKTITFDDLDL